jgi:hypothetical protein
VKTTVEDVMASLPLTPRSPAGWPGRVTYRKATIRDPYGRPAGWDSAELPARVRLTQVQLAEAGGARALRDGLVATVPWQDWLAVNDELQHRGQAAGAPSR